MAQTTNAPTYTHPDDIPIDRALAAPNAALLLATELRWLRGQRSTLAAALDRIDRGDGDDPTAIAAAALAEVGLSATGDGGGRWPDGITPDEVTEIAAAAGVTLIPGAVEHIAEATRAAGTSGGER